MIWVFLLGLLIGAVATALGLSIDGDWPIAAMFVGWIVAALVSLFALGTGVQHRWDRQRCDSYRARGWDTEWVERSLVSHVCFVRVGDQWIELDQIRWAEDS